MFMSQAVVSAHHPVPRGPAIWLSEPLSHVSMPFTRARKRPWFGEAARGWSRPCKGQVVEELSAGTEAGHMVTIRIKVRDPGDQVKAWRSLLGNRLDLGLIFGFIANIQGDLGSLTFLKCKIKGTGLVYQEADRTLFLCLPLPCLHVLSELLVLYGIHSDITSTEERKESHSPHTRLRLEETRNWVPRMPQFLLLQGGGFTFTMP